MNSKWLKGKMPQTGSYTNYSYPQQKTNKRTQRAIFMTYLHGENAQNTFVNKNGFGCRFSYLEEKKVWKYFFCIPLIYDSGTLYFLEIRQKEEFDFT